jgi:hypothetical protein
MNRGALTITKKITTAEAVIRRVVIDALKGDSRSQQTLFRLAEQIGPARATRDRHGHRGPAHVTKRSASRERGRAPMNDRTNEATYQVSYCRPPVHSRFKPGQSGNPSGRVKDSKNLKTLFHQILNEHIPLVDGTQSKNVTKAEALMRRLVIGALKGDSRSLMTLMYARHAQSLLGCFDLGGAPFAHTFGDDFD